MLQYIECTDKQDLACLKSMLRDKGYWHITGYKTLAMAKERRPEHKHRVLKDCHTCDVIYEWRAYLVNRSVLTATNWEEVKAQSAGVIAWVEVTIEEDQGVERIYLQSIQQK